eukprot:4586074-Pyramimonas_sp.AAC.1
MSCQSKASATYRDLCRTSRCETEYERRKSLSINTTAHEDLLSTEVGEHPHAGAQGNPWAVQQRTHLGRRDLSDAESAGQY